MFVNKFNKSHLITYFGIIFGVMALYFSFSSGHYVRYSLICLMLSGICDMFDGKFARMFDRSDREKEFGIQLDSLADTFCFLGVPIVIMLSLKLNSVVCLIIYCYFFISGVTRLGYFNVNADKDNPVDHYNGIPVTSTAIVYPVLGLLYNFISRKAFGIVYIVFTVVIGILFNFKIKIPKFKSILFYIVVPILASILIVLFWVLR